MNSRIYESVIGFCTTLILVLIPVYFLGLQTPAHHVRACRATACISSTAPSPIRSAREEITPSPAFIAQATNPITNKREEPAEEQQAEERNQNNESIPATATPAPQKTSKQPAHEGVEQPETAKQEETHDTEPEDAEPPAIVAETLQPVQTVLAGVTTLLK